MLIQLHILMFSNDYNYVAHLFHDHEYICSGSPHDAMHLSSNSKKGGGGNGVNQHQNQCPGNQLGAFPSH